MIKSVDLNSMEADMLSRIIQLVASNLEKVKVKDVNVYKSNEELKFFFSEDNYKRLLELNRKVRT